MSVHKEKPRHITPTGDLHQSVFRPGDLPVIKPKPASEVFPPPVASIEDFVSHLKKLDLDDLSKVISTYNRITEIYRFDQRRDLTLAVYHPVQTAIILTKAGFTDGDLLRVALLHDTVEDHPETYGITKGMKNRKRRQQASVRLTEEYGSFVSEGVLALTKPTVDGEEFHTKKEVEEAYLEQLAAANPLFVVVKMADRIHNLWTMDTDEIDRKTRQANETVGKYSEILYGSLVAVPTQEGRDFLIDRLNEGLTRLDVTLGTSYTPLQQTVFPESDLPEETQ